MGIFQRTAPKGIGLDEDTSSQTHEMAAEFTSSSGLTTPRLRIYRLVTLLSLLLSDGTYTVLRRYSRGVLHETYSVNEVLLLAEYLKLGFSCCVMMANRRGSGGVGGLISDDSTAPEGRRYLASHLMQLLLRSKKMLILSLIYGVGNVLSYFALARVGAGTFVVIANLKTLTTAGFSVMILGRSYSWAKWRALVLLVAGVILFVLPTLKASDQKVDMIANNDYSGIALGIGAEIIVVTLSGYAAIHFEKAIKDDPFDIWERNFQLGFYSVLMYSLLFFMEGGSEPFSNWTPLACILSVLGASGGLLIALSIKYGDAVLKTLAISGSIIYASVVDHIFLEGLFNEQMFLAAMVVVIAVLNYNFDATHIETSDNNSPSTFNLDLHNLRNNKAQEKYTMHEEEGSSDSEEKGLIS